MKLSPKVYDKDYFECKCCFKNFLTINYNRESNKIYLKPCSAIIPIDNQFLIYDPIYFVNNFDNCIKNYEKLNMNNLNEYYTGFCEVQCHLNNSIKLCQEYNFNTKVSNIQLDILQACNLNCVMCSHYKSFDKYEKELYVNILDCIKNSKYNFKGINPCIGGEPFLFKDILFNFISTCKNIQDILILTNGSLINKNDILNLSKYKNVKLRFSIDGIDKYTYEKIRVGGNFNKVIDIIKYAIELGICDKVHYVYQKENYGTQLSDVKKFFKKLGSSVEILIDGNLEKYDKEFEKNFLNNINWG